MNSKHLINPTKSKLTLLTQPHTIRTSPKISRIRATVRFQKTSEEIEAKFLTPKPRIKHSNSPFVKFPSKTSFTKLAPVQKASTHRIFAKSSGHSKNLTLGDNYCGLLSCIRMPPPLDFEFFIRHLLDHFESAESAAEYFFVFRGRELRFEEFFLSCCALALDKVFVNLERIYQEAKSEKCLTKNSFISKIISFQNSELKEDSKTQQPRLTGVFKKLINKVDIDYSLKSKGIRDAIRLAKGSDDLIARLQKENSKLRLTSKELNMLHDQRGPHVKNKKDLNLTMHVNCSPFSLMPVNSTNKKKNLMALNRSPTKRRNKS